MNVRELPPLQPLCDRHKHVVLLWDERIEGRSLLGVGAKRSLLVASPLQGAGTAGMPLWKRRSVEKLGPLGGWDTTCTKALIWPNRTNACLPPRLILGVGHSCAGGNRKSWWNGRRAA